MTLPLTSSGTTHWATTRDRLVSALETAAKLAQERVRRVGKTQFGTLVLEGPSLDPLIWLQGRSIGPAMYWRERNGEAEYGCLGSVRRLSLDGTNVIKPLCDAGRDVLDSCVVTNPRNPFAQPRLYGGFAFAGGAPKCGEWSDFPDGELILPEAVCIRAGERSYLVLCTAVDPKADVRRIVESFETLLHQYGSTDVPTATSSLPAILGIDDIDPSDQWNRGVETVLDRMKQGPLEKVVLSRKLRMRSAGPMPTWPVVAQLRAASPECFQFAFCFDQDRIFVGSTPERLFSLEGNALQSECIAGTIGRGTDTDADQSLADVLLSSEKERLEHFYVVEDMLRCLGDLCDDLDADTMPRVLKLATLQHLLTSARGHVRDGVGVGDILSRLHPTPAVGGVPRAAALAAIAEIEAAPRGWYAGPVGWMSTRRAEFAVAIRSAMLTTDGACIYAGAGIVPGSTPEREWRETQNKAHAFVAALQQP